MGKILLVLLLIGVIVWTVRRPQRPPPGSAPDRKPSRDDGRQLATMVRCAQCGLHLPRQEALPGRGGDYCSEAHRSEHERQLGSG